MVFSVFYPKLEGTNLGQGIIDVVEGIIKDMALFLPESTFFEEGQSFVLSMGEVYFF